MHWELPTAFPGLVLISAKAVSEPRLCLSWDIVNGSHLFVDLTAYGLPSQSFSTSALAPWKAATLGPRTSWPRLRCANPSRGGTTRLSLLLFCFCKSLSIFLTSPSCPLAFQPIAALCHSADGRHLSGFPWRLPWVQSQATPWVRASWDKAAVQNMAQSLKELRPK